METFVVLNVVIYLIVAFLLMTFGVFVIGFLVGYKREDKRLMKQEHQKQTVEITESDREKQAKKEWKKFLEYDGSAPTGSK